MEQTEVDSSTGINNQEKDSLKKGLDKRNKNAEGDPELLSQKHNLKLKSIIEEVYNLLKIEDN